MKATPSPRERVLQALRRQEPDRVPVYLTVTPRLARALSHAAGIDTFTLADSPLSQKPNILS
jgi:hypothetical protein